MGYRMSKEKYESAISIPKSRYEYIEQMLKGNIWLSDKENAITFTAKFPDGKEIDVKCCGTSEEGKPAWTEAVLFNEKGYEIACTEPGYEILGEWSIETDYYVYVVNVEIGA